MTHIDPRELIVMANTALNMVPDADWANQEHLIAQLTEALSTALDDADFYNGALIGQGEKLDRIAVALNGEPKPLSRWSHDGLPELVAEKMTGLAVLEAAVAETVADAQEVASLRNADANDFQRGLATQARETLDFLGVPALTYVNR